MKAETEVHHSKAKKNLLELTKSPKFSQELNKKKKKRVMLRLEVADRGESVAGVGDKHTSFPNSTITNRNTLNKPGNTHFFLQSFVSKVSQCRIRNTKRKRDNSGVDPQI